MVSEQENRKSIPRVGVYGGRFSPIHLGHEAIIRIMQEECDRIILFLGSINKPQSYRHFFSAEIREYLVSKIFPTAHIVKIADISVSGQSEEENNAERVKTLDMLIEDVLPGEKNITFYGGCEEDIAFFLDAGKQVMIANRFDGTTPPISATEVRDFLIGLETTEPNHDIRKLRLRDKNLVNPLIVDDLITFFHQERTHFKKK